MNTYQLLPSDRLLTEKDFVTHSGTYMGSGLVAHLSPKKGLCVEPIVAFLDGQKPRIVKSGGIEDSILWARYEQYKSKPDYGVFSNNCEHLSSFLQTGRATSPQLIGSVLGGGTGYLLARHLGIRNGYALTAIMLLAGVAGAKLAAPKADQLLIGAVA